MIDYCSNGHDLSDAGRTPRGECRACVRARQNAWVKTEKGKANYARTDARRRSPLAIPDRPPIQIDLSPANPLWMTQTLALRLKFVRSAIRLRHALFGDEDIRAVRGIDKAERTEIRLRHSADADIEVGAVLPAVADAHWWRISSGWDDRDYFVPDSAAIMRASLAIPRGKQYVDDFLTLPTAREVAARRKAALQAEKAYLIEKYGSMAQAKKAITNRGPYDPFTETFKYGEFAERRPS